MFSYLKSIKNGVIILMVIFALLTTFVFSVFSSYIMYSFQKKITIKSTEFNLQLVANIVEDDINDLTSLSKWCASNPEIIDYMSSSDNETNTKGMLAYTKMNNEFINSAVTTYIKRLIIVDKDYAKLLHVGNSVSSSIPITTYNINKLNDSYIEENSYLQSIVDDPFHLSEHQNLFPFITPIYSDTGEKIGTVYIGASTTVLTDKLKGYALLDGSELYLTLGDISYQIINNEFIYTDLTYDVIRYDTLSPTSNKTIVADIKNNNKLATSVSYPIRDNIVLTQILSNQETLPTNNILFITLILICILIILLALLIAFYLDRTIAKPIVNLNKRIDLISEGDFSFDPSIEFNNELGQVGKGINKLSNDIEALLESKLEDEKNKRRLEYKMLQNQINPHFLYNTLNSIKMMAIIQSADGIAEMSTSLSKLLRTVSKDTRTLVPLKDELSLIDEYIIIQKYRYSDSVVFKKSIENENLLETLIPRFSLQPIVENAIFHGIEPKGSGTITISISQIDDIVFCAIKDNGIGISREAITKILKDDSQTSGILGSVGIRNVDQRLRNSFGENFGLLIQSELNNYTIMTIRLPLNTKLKGE